MSLRVYDVPLANVTDFWSLASPILERAVRLNPHLDIEDLLIVLLADRAQMLVYVLDGNVQAVAVMERVEYPKRVVANILALAAAEGVRAPIATIVSNFKRWAKSHGCDRLAFIGRPGLERYARRNGGKSISLVHSWLDLQAD